jgi:hypothetical protein
MQANKDHNEYRQKADPRQACLLLVKSVDCLVLPKTPLCRRSYFTVRATPCVARRKLVSDCWDEPLRKHQKFDRAMHGIAPTS